MSARRLRVRAVRQYITWLAEWFGVPFPQELVRITDYSTLRVLELCHRGALKCTHQALVFLEEVAGAAEEDKITNKANHLQGSLVHSNARNTFRCRHHDH